jgi:hypothetical protein
MTNKPQSKVDERCLSTRGSQFCAPILPPPPKKDTICHWDWGEGVAGFDLAQKKKGWGCDYHEVDDDDDDDGKGGKQGKKY